MEAYPDAVPDALTDSGWLAGMPQLSMQTEATQAFGPLIRQDWLDELGLETPETYDELHDVLTAFKDQKGADAALALNYAATGINNGLVQGYGINGLVADAAMSEPFYQIRRSAHVRPHSARIQRVSHHGSRLVSRGSYLAGLYVLPGLPKPTN